MLKKSFKKKWLKALRSGEFKQGQRRLRSLDTDRFCCLGVACHLLVPNLWRKREDADEFSIRMNHGYSDEDLKEFRFSYNPSNEDVVRAWLPKKVVDKIGLTPTQMKALADLNDNGSTFKEIADYIEKNL